MNEYKTVHKEAYNEFTEKRSRFIGYACPVKTVDEANAFISRIKQKHWDAKHNVYAYILKDGGIKRYSDDGEPQGTAGIPVLDVLEKSQTVDVCVVVTRYFGGILLGASGLVRAYTNTAKIGIDSAGIITMASCKIAELTCDYNFYGRLQTIISSFGIITEDADFSAFVCLTLRIPEETFEKFDAEVFDKSCGKTRCKVIAEKFSKIQ